MSNPRLPALMGGRSDVLGIPIAGSEVVAAGDGIGQNEANREVNTAGSASPGGVRRTTMQIRFWRDRRPWRPTSTHQSAPNPWLERHWGGLRLEQGSTVFVPMCGKSDDLRWLLGRGHQGLGIELADLAIEAYFEEAGEPYEREDSDRLVRYRGPRTDIFCGDFFALTAAELSSTRAVLDRGALIALPPKMRARYVDHMLRVVPDRTDILLVTLEYDQNLVAGPPFSVLPEEVVSHFGARCSIVPLESSRTEFLPPKFAAQGVDCAAQTAYHIVKQE